MINLKKLTSKLVASAFLMTSIILPGTVAYGNDYNIQPINMGREKWANFEPKVAADVGLNSNREIIVKYRNCDKGKYVKSSVQKSLSLSPFKVKNMLRKNNIEVLEIADSEDMNKVISEFENNPDVEYAQPNYRLELFSSLLDQNERGKSEGTPSPELLFLAQDEPRFDEQWGLCNNAENGGIKGFDINALTAWEMSTGSPEIVVGVIDTGIDINHPDLRDNIYRNPGEIPGNGIDDDCNGYVDDVNGWDFALDDNSVFDSEHLEFHGTHVSGIVAASQNGQGVVGVAPGVKILPLKMCDERGNADTEAAIEAIEYANSLGVKIINCSWGSGYYNQALYDVMQKSDIIFVCASGNSGSNNYSTPVYPSSYNLSNVISVAAVDNCGNLAKFSNYGENVDVAAPGVNILSTLPSRGYGYMSGTSMSAPFVTGALALLKSYYKDMSNTYIVNRLKENMLKVKQEAYCYGGILDIGAAFDRSNRRILTMMKYMPSGFSTSVTSNSITISWDDIVDIDEYEVEVDRTIKTVTQETYYRCNGLEAGSGHMFRVRSLRDGEALQWSDAVFEFALDPGKGIGLLGEYYDSMNFEDYMGATLDETINFNWGSGSPKEYMDVDTFSVRWTGQIEPEFTEDYTFYACAGDGVRVWLDGQLIIDDWRDKGIGESKGIISLEANKKYDIKVEYYESLGNAKVQLWWSSNSQSKEIVPAQHLYPSPTGEMWKNGSVMPTSRLMFGMVQLNDEIYAAGGISSSAGIMDTVEKYNPHSDKWSYLAELPYSYFANSLVTLNGNVHTLGGITVDANDKQTFASEIYRLESDEKSWSYAGRLSSPRANMGAVELDGRIYVVGGENEMDCLKTLEAFDPSVGLTTLRDMPTSRGGLCVAAVNGKIYAIGGYSYDNGYSTLNTVEEYNPKTNNWTQKTSMLVPRESAAVAVADGKIYVIGGMVYNPASGDIVYLSIVEVYDPQTDTWELAESMPTERAALGAAAVGNKIYAVGGMNNLGYEDNKVEEYTVPYPPAKDTARPVIAIDQSNCTVDQAVFRITGRVNEAAIVRVNGKAAAFSDDLIFGSNVQLSSGQNSIIVEATDLSGNVSRAGVVITYNGTEDNIPPAPYYPSTGGGGTSAPSQSSEQKAAKVDPVSGEIRVKPTLKSGGTAVAEIEINDINKAINIVKSSDTVKTVRVDVSKVSGTKRYDCVFPSEVLSKDKNDLEIEISTDVGIIILPGNMFGSDSLSKSDKVTISCGFVDTEELSDEISDRISGRPVVELKVLVNGKAVEWKNNQAQISVLIDYDAKDYELEDDEFIVVWFVDSKGNITPVPSGRYDKEAKQVSFKTNRLSRFAVGYIKKTFDDLEKHDWAKRQIEVLASKGIINGTSEFTFAPGSNITRADFMILLVKALGLDADIKSNFDDVKEADYYYEAVGIAKSLGITSGVGDNKFLPKEQIKREDMMVLVDKALRIADKLETEGKALDIEDFDDDSSVSSYAVKSVATLVKEGIVSGSGNRLNPKSNTTRAEVAALIYRIYNK